MKKAKTHTLVKKIEQLTKSNSTIKKKKINYVQTDKSKTVYKIRK